MSAAATSRTPITLKAIGFWIGDLEDETLPAPQEFVALMPPDERDRLATYLAAGMTANSYLGYSWCRFGCGISPTEMGDSDLTDGTWAWPQGLAHYVREHSVMLPTEFVQHALARSTPVVDGWVQRDFVSVLSGAMDLADLEEPEIDQAFWLEWCAAHRSAAALERIRAGRRASQALAATDSAAERARQVSDALNQHGLSTDKCQWRNCGRPALAGKYICVDHLLGQPNPDPLNRQGTELVAILGELSAAHGVQADFSSRKWQQAAAVKTLGPATAQGRRASLKDWFRELAQHVRRHFRRGAG